MKKIGVQKGLSTIADYLSSQGYSVEILGEDFQNNIAKCDNLDAIVIANYNTNMMGFSDSFTQVPIINAEGLTQEDIKNIIDQKITR
ncbi:Uncharacterised protein family (UPF0180) [Clostridium cavendishii DSM 21758]|uniref:Uncharacterized protein family (UPF0180) n=1 Tax=Clostridium cavendishii DSM 21758 TaxID=1121302 RepID=A0A1M6BFB4_9CLOT|nr:YkuS family protein [Clostridium cavendishii]SHI47431.1 Uncharacterised protein family (UPF0180) [Clostridium cavendishii DSM 21758]